MDDGHGKIEHVFTRPQRIGLYTVIATAWIMSFLFGLVVVNTFTHHPPTEQHQQVYQ